MVTYCILSAIFFVLYILFQGLQSIGEKLNDITRTYENKKPEDENSFAQRCKCQIEYEKTLVPDSEELRKVREDFEKAYLEERESVRLKMCEGYDKSKKAIAYSPEYYAGNKQYDKYDNLFFPWKEILSNIQNADHDLQLIILHSPYFTTFAVESPTTSTVS